MEFNGSVTQIPLVGPRYQKLLEKLEIKTVGDLLYHFPFRYNDFSRITTISNLISGEAATIRGELTSIKNIYTRAGRNFVQGVLKDDDGEVLLVWFNQPFLTRNLHSGDKLTVSGNLGTFGGKPAVVSPEYELSPEIGATIHVGRLVPVYSETAGISSKWFRSRIHALTSTSLDTAETLPKQVIVTERFPLLTNALRQIHFPKNQEEAVLARNRFAFEELFNLSLKSLVRRAKWQQEQIAKGLVVDQVLVDQFTSNLPFKLTAAQNRVTHEILDDLQMTSPMNRLLEGDVGSGKTVVAAIAAYVTTLNGQNVLYMAPTEILAKQHLETFTSLFSKYDIDIELVLGGRKKESKKQEARSKILIGTHALLYRDDFNGVGLIVIDEQHRFGVEQRAELLRKCQGGATPHLLTMTATPIPRSLQLVLMGDLDLSVLDEMPVGRKTVKTWLIPKNKREDAYNWLKELKTQTFVVCPFIEESETETLQAVKAAKKEFEILQKELTPLKLGLLHGKLKPAEKDIVVQNFRNGKLDVLVSTPVVEVGVDIPNASVMIIEGAERFGLASLHQLRGRVGRAGQEAYCLLFSSDENSNKTRLKALETNFNGADLAEIDLKFRGSGDIFGTMQHGLPVFKVADPSNLELINKARKWAEDVVTNLEEYPEMKSRVEEINNELITPN